MKVFLDDIRNVPEEYNYNVVRNYDACIEIISVFRNMLEFVSLDYSLGTVETGFDVLVFMVENNITPKYINIHSDHPEGVPKIRKYAEDNFPNTIISCNRV